MRIPLPFSRALPALAGLASIVILASCFRSESFIDTVPPEETRFPSAREMNARLGKGMNVGNALDAPSEGAWGVTLKAEWFKAIAESGFATVRIPVRWSAHAAKEPPYGIDSVFMDRVAWAVDLALSAGLNAVVDMHHYDQLMAAPAAEKERFLAMWRQIARRFSGYPPNLLLELLNEPRDGMTAKAWNELLAAAVDTIRTRDPRRTLVVGTSAWGSLSGLPALELPRDTNLIVTVHYYDPLPFTHQGAAFVPGADAWLGTRWRATPAQRALVDQDIAVIKAWSEEHGRPIFLGEFGTYSAADSVSRTLYTSYLATAFAEAGFSWAFWNWSTDFGIVDDATGAWKGWLADALLRPGRNAMLDSILKSGTAIDPGRFLVFDDFEDGLPSLPAALVPWLRSRGREPDSTTSGWYTFYSDSSRMESPDGGRLLQFFETGPGKLPPDFGKTIGDWGYQGKGFHARLVLKGDGYPWGGFGAGLFEGWDSRFTDLGKLSAVQFRARGKGEWTIQVVTDSIYNGYPKADNGGQMSWSFNLKDRWETFLIPASALSPKKYSLQEQEGLVWEDVRNKVIGLEFMNGQSYGKVVEDTLEIQLDDIRLIGVDSADFLP